MTGRLTEHEQIRYVLNLLRRDPFRTYGAAEIRAIDVSPMLMGVLEKAGAVWMTSTNLLPAGCSTSALADSHVWLLTEEALDVDRRGGATALVQRFGGA